MSDVLEHADLHVGMTAGPARYAVEQRAIDAYRTAVACGARTDTAPTAPPTFAAVYTRPALDLLPAPPGGVHAKQRYAFHGDVRAGDVILTELTVTATYVKRGRKYVEMRTVSRSERAGTVAVGEITRIWAR